MSNIESALRGIDGFDLLAQQDTPIHRRDPRAKVVVAIMFIVTVVSYGKYELSGLMPLFLYPVALITLGHLPAGYLLRKLLLAAPFAIVIGLFNPFLDRAVLLHLGPVGISGGWISFLSILLRFALTLSAALILISTTGFNAVCLALTHLKMPQVLTVQFMLLYRYLFVLAEEGARMHKAWSLRSVDGHRIPLRIFGQLIGQWIIRAMNRAQRVYLAMLSRGFNGNLPMTHPLHFRVGDALFMIAWMGFFILARWINWPQALGRTIMGILQ
jgi:cobalt/nickel transport system permease protein